MSDLDLQQIQENNEKDIAGKENPKKKKKNGRIKWWQGLLLILSTLIISLAAGYFISEKYIWPKIDVDRVNQQLAFYKEKVEFEPNSSEHRVNLGYTYFIKGDNSEAIKQLKVATDLDKNNFNAFLNLAIVYNDDKQFDDALKFAQKAVKLSPRDYKGHMLKGIAYRNIKMYEESLASLNEANRLMPRNVDIIYEVGKLAEDQGLSKEAEGIYKEALSYDPLHKSSLEGLERVAAK
jgi:tetratricopeptide (TPR) repeat protein